MDVTIILGSKSDLPVADKCSALLEEFDISHEVRVASAHRAPKYLEGVVDAALEDGCRIFVGIAGMSAALPGVIASMTTRPVIGVPVGGKVPLDSLLSVVQMPPGMPVAAVGVDRGENAADKEDWHAPDHGDGNHTNEGPENGGNDPEEF